LPDLQKLTFRHGFFVKNLNAHRYGLSKLTG